MPYFTLYLRKVRGQKSCPCNLLFYPHHVGRGMSLIHWLPALLWSKLLKKWFKEILLNCRQASSHRSPWRTEAAFTHLAPGVALALPQEECRYANEQCSWGAGSRTALWQKFSLKQNFLTSWTVEECTTGALSWARIRLVIGRVDTEFHKEQL